MRRYDLLTLLVGGVLLAGCDETRPESLVDDLRFVAASVEPPEVVPGERIAVNWEIGDGAGEAGAGLEYLFLPCSGFAGLTDCLEFGDLVALYPQYLQEDGTITEEGYRAYLETFVQRGLVPAGTLTLRFNTAFTLAFVLSDPSIPPVETPEGEVPTVQELDGTVSLLVCVPGVCDGLLEEVDAVLAGGDGVRPASELLDRLTTFSYLEELPMEGNAVASMRYRMTLREEGDPNRNLNPTIDQVLIDGATLDDRATVASGAQVGISAVLSSDDLQFYVRFDDEGNEASERETATVRWLSTLGAFTPAEVFVEQLDATISSSFLAPEVNSETEVSVWVTVEDERYGSSWVERTLVVTP